MSNFQKLTKAQLIKKLNQLQSKQVAYDNSHELHSLHHDLEVHQIELEMQNRELREKQQDIELARDKYADLYEFAPLSYLTLDNKGVIRNINLTGAGMLNATREYLLGKPFSAYLCSGYSGKFFHALSITTKSDTESNLELELIRKDNIRFYARASMIPSTTDDQSVRMALLDISEQKRAETEARENRDALIHAGRLNMLGELSSGIAHEVSQPLAAISIYAETLRDLAGTGKLSESELFDIAEHITSQTQRARVILDRIRSFSRREARYESEQNILHVINEAVKLVQPTLKSKCVSINIGKPLAILNVKIDRIQIIQVLVNLLQNAIEAMTETPIEERKIEIIVKIIDHNRVELAVLDHGTGIPPDMKDHLFMPFFTNRKEGLGLGLSLSHSIIQAHGGRLWAEANHPQGSIFRFTLPAAKNK